MNRLNRFQEEILCDQKLSIVLFFGTETYRSWIENAADTLQMYNCILSGRDNIGLALEQMGVGNYLGDCNIFHNDNPGLVIVVGYNIILILT